MAKKTQRRAAAARQERDQLGCMWGFMNMFGFRHGPMAHKRLLDQKHSAGNHRNKELDDTNVTITIIKPSVKKLIAQELCIEDKKIIKKQRENAEAGHLSDSGLQGRRKNHRRKNKKSCDNFSTIDSEVPQRRNHHGSVRSLDIDNMIEEFIHRKSTSDGDYKEKRRDLVKFGNSPDSHLMRNKERNSSHFFLSEIRRKLKQAIRREQPGHIQREGFPKNVPTKDHFFLERMAKPSTCHKKSHNVLDEHNEDDKKQRVSNIYTEAKRHLSEMLNNGDLDSNSTSRQVQRTLGGILSLPEYLSPLSSPGRRREKSSVAHGKSDSADFINVVNIKHPEDAMENADSESLKPTTSEPTESSVDIEDDTAYKDITSSVGSADNVMIISEIDPEEASSTLAGDLSKDEAHDEQRDGIISKQTFHEECKTAITDLPEWSSPISVLEPLFIEDDISPAKMRSQSGEAQVQPWCIHFDEKDSAAKTRDGSVNTITSDKELVFQYVKAVLEALDSDLEELYLKAQFSDQLLEPPLISNIPFYENQLCPDHELLFDCINEVLMELCCCPPWASFVSPKTRVFSTVKTIIHEVQEAVYWHLLPLSLPHALDQILRKDMAKAGNWLDIRCDIDCIGFETSEMILHELLEELTLNFLYNSDHSLVPVESIKCENSLKDKDIVKTAASPERSLNVTNAIFH